MCIGNNFSNIFCSLMIYLIINRCILKVFLKKLLIFIPIYESILIYATKKSLIYNQGLKRADDGNRTRDLRLTKATLYLLSHSSIGRIDFFRQLLYTITQILFRQDFFLKQISPVFSSPAEGHCQWIFPVYPAYWRFRNSFCPVNIMSVHGFRNC